jgi:hypothetical protein
LRKEGLAQAVVEKAVVEGKAVMPVDGGRDE